MKKCTRCNKNKSLDSFQKRVASKDGLTASCKKCLSEYDKQRANLPHRVKARKEYSKTENGKLAATRASRVFRQKNPLKYKAHNIVNNAMRDGHLFKELCEECGREKVQAHHDDYLKPLNVRWLCDYHHKKWHKENGEGKNAK